MLLLYINDIFFVENFDKVYWTEGTSTNKIFDISLLSDLSEASGPFRDRITMRISQATSSLLPLGLVLFSLINLFCKNKIIAIWSSSMICISLFTILETLTRSMLASAIVPIALSIAWLLINHTKSFRKKIVFLLVPVIFTIILMNIFNLEKLWLGRTISLLNTFKYSENNDSEYYAKGEQKHVKDENAMVRLLEYKIALDIFKSKPLFGAGIGIQHDIAFQVNENQFLKQKVGYFHNWIFYWLMVGGVVGLLFYLFVLFAPLWYILNLDKQFMNYKFILSSLIITMSLYSCFFAVFRLLEFNLILAINCGIALYLRHNDTLKRNYVIKSQ
jgi:O-antigen ligase